MKNLDIKKRYGYRGRDCRANVYLLPTGEIVYFIASVVILFNYEERTQRHYLGHTDCVKWLVYASIIHSSVIVKEIDSFMLFAMCLVSNIQYTNVPRTMMKKTLMYHV